MRTPQRTACEIAKQQIDELTSCVGCADQEDARLGHGLTSFTSVLVMGDDNRPYLVYRAVDRICGGWLCSVAVSAAGWTRRLRQPVLRQAVTLEPPATMTNKSTPRASAIYWHELNEG